MRWGFGDRSQTFNNIRDAQARQRQEARIDRELARDSAEKKAKAEAEARHLKQEAAITAETKAWKKKADILAHRRKTAKGAGGSPKGSSGGGSFRSPLTTSTPSINNKKFFGG